MEARPTIQLITTQLLNSPERLRGLETFLEANSAEPLIRRIVVLAEQLDAEIAQSLQERYPRLQLVAWHERPDFQALIAAARLHGLERVITVVCNADLWLDLQHSDVVSLGSALQQHPQLAFSLTRRQDDDPQRLLSVDGVLPELASSDAWLFSGLPHPFPLKGVFLGTQDVERLVHAGLLQTGYRLANACHWLRAIHLEASVNDYQTFNLDLLYQATLANPALARVGIPPSLAVVPPGLGPYGPEAALYLDRFTQVWEAWAERWILVDLCGATAQECLSAVLWLLFLARSYDRTLIAHVDRSTDPQLLQVLDRFHAATGRALCCRGLGLERLRRQGFQREGLWLSSPAVLGPQLLLDGPHRPMVVLNCREPHPIKGSWLYHYNLSSVGEQLQAMAIADATAVVRLIDPASVSWWEVQLITCTYRADADLPDFLEHSSPWISTTAAYGHRVLHAFCDVQPSPMQRQQLLAALERRPGWLLELPCDPGLYASWNQMIGCSEERYLSNANPDDRRSPDQLGRLVDLLAAAPERMVASSAVVPIHSRRCLRWSFDRLQRQGKTGLWFGDVPDGYDLSQLYRMPVGLEGAVEPHNVPHCSPVWRRDVHGRCGWFDEARYGSAADWALWCRYGFEGGQFCHTPEPLSGYFVNPGSYGRRQGHSLGQQRIVAEFLRPETPAASELESKPQSPPEQLQVCPPSAPATGTRIRIHGGDAFYGEHRFSNNQILESLADWHDDSAPLRFIWFLERFFLWGNGPGERHARDFGPIREPWLGVLHVPPLTPAWAGNQFAELYALREWRDSLPHCRGLIALSSYMAEDLRSLFPRIPVYSVKHPCQPFSRGFDLQAFQADPKVVLVGYWLRRHLQFYRWRAPLPKIHLLKRYSSDFMQREWQALGTPTPEELASVEQRRFLPEAEFDALLASSLVFLGLYETSGNNAVVECLSMGAPFVADRHPALEEYVGRGYPLLLEPGELERLGRQELLERTAQAHRYLADHPGYRRAIGYGRFRSDLQAIVAAAHLSLTRV